MHIQDHAHSLSRKKGKKIRRWQGCRSVLIAGALLGSSAVNAACPFNGLPFAFTGSATPSSPATMTGAMVNSSPGGCCWGMPNMLMGPGLSNQDLNNLAKQYGSDLKASMGLMKSAYQELLDYMYKTQTKFMQDTVDNPTCPSSEGCFAGYTVAYKSNVKNNQKLFSSMIQSVIAALNSRTQAWQEQEYARGMERRLAKYDNRITRRLSTINQAMPIRNVKGSPLFSIIQAGVSQRSSRRTAQQIAGAVYDDIIATRFSDERVNAINSFMPDTIEIPGEDGMTHEVPDPSQDNAFLKGVFPQRGEALNPNRFKDREVTPDGVQEDIRLAFLAMLNFKPPQTLPESMRHSRVGQQYEARRRTWLAQRTLALESFARRLGAHFANEPVPPYVDYLWYREIGFPGTVEEARNSTPSSDIEQPPGVVFVEQDDGSYERRISAHAIHEMQTRQFTDSRDFSADLSQMTQLIGPERELAEMQRVQLDRQARRAQHWERIAAMTALTTSVQVQDTHDQKLESLYEQAEQVRK